ncbi:hypothetical protein DFH28DRAFT_871192, partial [Melampsora americana]
MSTVHESIKLVKNLHWNLKQPTRIKERSLRRRKENLMNIERYHHHQTITNQFKSSHQTFQVKPLIESRIKREPLIQNITSHSISKPFITNPSNIISVTQTIKMKSTLKQEQTRSISRSQINSEYFSKLPPFQLTDIRYPTPTIYLCPSSNHPINSLESLMEKVIQDGISLDHQIR